MEVKKSKAHVTRWTLIKLTCNTGDELHIFIYSQIFDRFWINQFCFPFSVSFPLKF